MKGHTEGEDLLSMLEMVLISFDCEVHVLPTDTTFNDVFNPVLNFLHELVKKENMAQDIKTSKSKRNDISRLFASEMRSRALRLLLKWCSIRASVAEYLNLCASLMDSNASFLIAPF